MPKAYVVGALRRNSSDEWVLRSVTVVSEPAGSLTMYGGTHYIDLYCAEGPTKTQVQLVAEETARAYRKRFFGNEEGSGG